MFPVTESWFQWALLSAVFAALTAILAKVGLAGIDSDFATLVRTVVILVALAAFVGFTGKWSNPFALEPKPLLFLTLSGLATGASWVCYFRALKAGDAAKVAPVDKLSLVLVAVFAVLFLHEPACPPIWYPLAKWRMDRRSYGVPEDVLLTGKLRKFSAEFGMTTDVIMAPTLTSRGPIQSIYYLGLKTVPLQKWPRKFEQAVRWRICYR